MLVEGYNDENQENYLSKFIPQDFANLCWAYGKQEELKIETSATVKVGETKTPATPTREINAVSKRKTRGFIQFRIIAPIKRDTVCFS